MTEDRDTSTRTAVVRAQEAIRAARKHLALQRADAAVAELDALLAQALRRAEALLEGGPVAPGACPICGATNFDGVYCGWCNNGAF